MIIAFISIVLKFYIFSNILQQSYYEFKFLIRFLFKKIYLFIPSILFVIYNFLVCDFLLWIAIFLSIFLTFYLYKNMKIKLKFTKRIIRLFISFVLLTSILSIFVPMVLLEPFTPVIVLMSMVINKPIEIIINKKYIKRSQVKIKEVDAIKIAITGSYGKTSVKNYIAQIIKNNYLVLSTPNSYNTPLGISRFINSVNLIFCDFFIYEFGARRKNDIKELKKLYNYDIAVVTGINEMHIDTFKTQEAIIHEKMSIVEGVSDRGFAILNYECPYIRNYAVIKKKYTYGFNYGDFLAKNVKISLEGSEFDLYHRENFVRHFSSNLIGRQSVLNLIPSIIISLVYGIELGNIENIEGVKNRLTRRENDGYIILDDAYNSNILGVEYALEVLASHIGQKVIITPGLVELEKVKEIMCYKYAKLIDEVCDACILVSNGFTKQMSQDIKRCKVYIVKSFVEGFELYLNIKENNSVLLIENDLTDAY